MTIKTITKIYTRTYSDSGQVKTYVEWLDQRGKAGRTEGDRYNTHMAALIERGMRKGVTHTVER